MKDASHIIRNFDALSKTRLRQDGLKILEAGLRAAMPDAATRAACARKSSRLRIGGHAYDLRRYRRISVIGIGKAAGQACAALERILGGRLADWIVIDTRRHGFRRIRSYVGDHPFPTSRNIRATDALLRLLKSAEPSDLIIAVISGGGSSLLCRPAGVSLRDLILISRRLMRKGVPIERMNAVRKRLSSVHGGRLALATRATLIGLLYSDIPGGDISSVASGPTMRDPSTRREAVRTLRACGLGRYVRRLQETPRDRSLFRRVRNVLVLDNTHALAAMAGVAKKLGYRARILRDPVAGEARDAGRRLVRSCGRGEALIAGGETTVKISGRGVGGRNQEAALAALEAIGDAVFLSCASDGIDNGPAAGAIADAMTREKAERAKLDPVRHLRDNDSYPFFRKLRQSLMTGRTGANVADLFLVVRGKRERAP